MFRNKLSAEVILGVLCLIAGSIVLGFLTLVLDLFDGGYRERLEYMGWEELIFTSIFFLSGFVSIACSYGLFRQKRWAVILMSLIFMGIMFVAAFVIIGESRFFVRQPLQALTSALAGIGLPLCMLLLFNSTRVFPWLAPKTGFIETDILDGL
ncbi:MAG: hypothetical protein AAFR36_08190 [Bacteroidota bacterium]